ncbi:MAG: S-layer homology domain-containing protein [Clostridia bacterium]|nr:S-layer homology domain-containing protein [Clostridia bacterium]
MYRYKIKLSIIMCLIMIFAMFNFTLAEPSDWAENYMKSMLMEELASPKLLNPDLMQQPITREEFAELTVWLYAKAKNMNRNDLVQWNPFSDTDNEMVAKAFNIGIVSGTGYDQLDRRVFSPKNKVTRQEMAVMIVKELRLLGIDVTPKYTLKFADDSSIASWAYDAVAYASESGIISGVGDNKVAPTANATREQAMTIINKIALKYKYIDNKELSSKFSTINAKKVYGFWMPTSNTQLRALQTDTGIKYTISYIVSSYVADLEGQIDDLLNILINTSAVDYTSFVTIKNWLEEAYDPISKTYEDLETIYVNLATSKTTFSPIKNSIKLSIDNAIIVEYIK